MWDSHIAGTINKEGQSYYLTDAQGSPLALYEADSHEEQESYHYDEYGNNEKAGTGKHPISYTGYLYDPISDSYHAKAREYDPKTGRYQSRDEEKYLHPEIPISLNQYQYCLSNPISYTDPDGHECPSDEVITPFSMEQLFMEAITAYRFGSSPEILQYYAWQMAECSPELLMRLQQKQKLELEVENYWNQENGYFSGPWWQDEKKLTEAYKYLLKETSYANLTMLGLAERFLEGVTDNRIYALQELVGTTRTGKYEANTMIALKSVLLSQGVQDIDDFNPKLDTETLQTIRTWYNTSSKTGRYIGYWLENGGQDIIMGAGVLAVGTYAANQTKIDASVKKGIGNAKNKISGKPTGKGGVKGSETYKVSSEVKTSGANANQKTSGSKTPEQVLKERTKDFDLKPHPTSQKQLSSKKMSELKAKIDNRTITKTEYEQYSWNKKITKIRQTAVDSFWDDEIIRIKENVSSRNWSQTQIDDIMSGIKPKYNGQTLQGHHSYSVSKYPHLAGKSEVIWPATPSEHLSGWHGGNWKNTLPGKPIYDINEF